MEAAGSVSETLLNKCRSDGGMQQLEVSPFITLTAQLNSTLSPKSADLYKMCPVSDRKWIIIGAALDCDEEWRI